MKVCRRCFQEFSVLRLNLPFKDLAYRFKISQPTASRIWHKIINIMHQRMKFLIQWPKRETGNNANGFSSGGWCCCHSRLLWSIYRTTLNRFTRAQTSSNYKHYNTVKFLIGVSPQGLVSCKPIAWGGRASDKRITALGWCFVALLWVVYLCKLWGLRCKFIRRIKCKFIRQMAFHIHFRVLTLPTFSSKFVYPSTYKIIVCLHTFAGFHLVCGVKGCLEH